MVKNWLSCFLWHSVFVGRLASVLPRVDTCEHNIVKPVLLVECDMADVDVVTLFGRMSWNELNESWMTVMMSLTESHRQHVKPASYSLNSTTYRQVQSHVRVCMHGSSTLVNVCVSLMLFSMWSMITVSRPFCLYFLNRNLWYTDI